MDSACVQRLASRVGLSRRQGGWFRWPAVEASIGLRLPVDYKRLVETFPDGIFRGLVHLNRPGDYGQPASEFLGYYAYLLQDLRDWRAGGYGSYPYPIFPEPGGLLPWARGPRMEPFFWLTEAEDPNAWPVVVADYDRSQWRLFPGPACEFLLEVVDARFDAGFLGVDLASHQPDFESIVEDTTQAPQAPGPSFWRSPAGANSEFVQLANLLGPPPVSPPAVDWGQVEARMGLRLPADYRFSIDTYGAGTYCDITVAAPGAPAEVDLYSLLERRYANVVDLDRTELDPPVYPEPGGLIAWGQTADGWTCGWVPNHTDPDRWGIVVCHPKGMLVHEPETSFSAFLCRHAQPDPVVESFPGRPAWTGGPRFIPYRA